MAPKGLKTTSSPLQISSQVQETVLAQFISVEIPLTLNVLDNEVFVVTQLNIDCDAPTYPAVAGSSFVAASLSSTERTTVGTISDSNVIGAAAREIVSGGTPPNIVAVAFEREDPLFAAISEDYLGIVATNNMFLNLQCFNNQLDLKRARVRVYGYRASAGSSVYAALVQSELLSS